ncbi:hypothetical protein HDU98_004011 [Podochytrium sp. JEL0797]|nr:hypothetical protein HDU98_004011 [Podochytrium sp. JEL0797]
MFAWLLGSTSRDDNETRGAFAMHWKHVSECGSDGLNTAYHLDRMLKYFASDASNCIAFCVKHNVLQVLAQLSHSEICTQSCLRFITGILQQPEAVHALANKQIVAPIIDILHQSASRFAHSDRRSLLPENPLYTEAKSTIDLVATLVQQIKTICPTNIAMFIDDDVKTSMPPKSSSEATLHDTSDHSDSPMTSDLSVTRFCLFDVSMDLAACSEPIGAIAQKCITGMFDLFATFENWADVDEMLMIQTFSNFVTQELSIRYCTMIDAGKLDTETESIERFFSFWLFIDTLCSKTTSCPSFRLISHQLQHTLRSDFLNAFLFKPFGQKQQTLEELVVCVDDLLKLSSAGGCLAPLLTTLLEVTAATIGILETMIQAAEKTSLALLSQSSISTKTNEKLTSVALIDKLLKIVYFGKDIPHQRIQSDLDPYFFDALERKNNTSASDSEISLPSSVPVISLLLGKLISSMGRFEMGTNIKISGVVGTLAWKISIEDFSSILEHLEKLKDAILGGNQNATELILLLGEMGKELLSIFLVRGNDVK